jgi:hypothetical protein
VTTTKTWHAEVFIYEEGDHTKADVVLRTDAGTELRASGMARRNPTDREVPEIGDELAACRAFGELAHMLLEAATADVETNMGAAATIPE